MDELKPSFVDNSSTPIINKTNVITINGSLINITHFSNNYNVNPNLDLHIEFGPMSIVIYILNAQNYNSNILIDLFNQSISYKTTHLCVCICVCMCVCVCSAMDFFFWH